MTEKSRIACHECDLLMELETVPEGNKAECPRCGYILSAVCHNSSERVLAFSVTGLVFLFLSFIFPFLTFSAQGQDRTVTLVQSISVMVDEKFTSLAVLIFISIIVIPGFYLLSSIYIFLSLKSSTLLPWTRQVIKLIGHLQHWSMAEIFLIGILVSFIKITSLAEVGLGLSFWSYCFFILGMTAAVPHIDKYQIWSMFKNKEKISQSQAITSENYQGCHVCTDVAERTLQVCPTCDSKFHLKNIKNIQQTWALVMTSVVLYIPANILPIMRTNFLGQETENTILGGVIVLWEHGSYPIALIIFIASVLVPVGKILALSWLCYSVQTNSSSHYHQKTKLYRATELIGRWSMVDVFVVAILVALIKLGNIMSIYPDWGAVAFAGMVIVTVLAAINFDPRFIWDPLNKEKL